MSRYVVDASVVAKWVLPVEPHQEEALRLKADNVAGRNELFAPAILSVEVANALWKAVRMNRLSREDAKAALAALGHMGVFLCEFKWDRVSEIFDIACRLEVAVYDAAYLYLAQEIKAQFVTSDDALFEKSKSHFQVLNVRDY